MSIPSPTNATAFWEYIRKEKMAKNDYDFYKYVFPDFLYTVNEFFWTCTRSDESDFRLFPQDVSFAGATFLANAKFYFINFSGKTNFSGLKFNKDAHFRKTQFSGRADFSGASFVGNSNFSGADFREDAKFSYSGFSGWADFTRAKFVYAAFRYCAFSGLASFEHASCAKGSVFLGATGNMQGLVNGRIRAAS
jgi:uncharacterized protein YjbI with pentapeptide repeats